MISSPNKDPAKMTKMAETRMPIRPLNSLLGEQPPPSPSSSDIDSYAENERERELGLVGLVGLGGRGQSGEGEGVSGVCLFRWLQVR